jgi:hypothetical protein
MPLINWQLYFNDPEDFTFAIGQNAIERALPIEEDNTHQCHYARGKAQIGFDNFSALIVFTEILNDMNVETDLRAKASKSSRMFSKHILNVFFLKLALKNSKPRCDRYLSFRNSSKRLFQSSLRKN